MSTHQHYLSRAAASWTRIDMLLALYGGLLRTLAQGRDRLQAGHSAGISDVRAKAYRQLMGLIDGIDLDQGDLPCNVLRLLLFIWDHLERDDPQVWSTCFKLVETLQQAFHCIAEQARGDEQVGLIPPLNN